MAIADALNKMPTNYQSNKAASVQSSRTTLESGEDEKKDEKRNDKYSIERATQSLVSTVARLLLMQDKYKKRSRRRCSSCFMDSPFWSRWAEIRVI